MVPHPVVTDRITSRTARAHKLPPWVHLGVRLCFFPPSARRPGRLSRWLPSLPFRLCGLLLQPARRCQRCPLLWQCLSLSRGAASKRPGGEESRASRRARPASERGQPHGAASGRPGGEQSRAKRRARPASQRGQPRGAAAGRSSVERSRAKRRGRSTRERGEPKCGQF